MATIDRENPRRIFPPHGSCIYCGAKTDLTTEHIIPESLGGLLEMPEASCATCASITTKFEQRFARNMYWPLRLKLGIKGKRHRRKKRPTHWNVCVDDGMTSQTFPVAIDDLPTMYYTVEMPPHGIVVGHLPSDSNPEMKILFKVNREELERFGKQMDAGQWQITHFFDWDAFNLQLAKIAHGITVAACGSIGLELLLPKIIFGKAKTYSHFIGGIVGPSSFQNELTLFIKPLNREQYVSCYITLLNGKLPTYEVISARITDIDVIAKNLRSFTRVS